jgi:hypothetical protein
MKVAIFTRFNDNRNIIEFMKYHYSIGINKIFIYNDGNCNIEKICKKYFPKTKDNNYTYPFDIFNYKWIKKNDIATLNTSIKFYESVITHIKSSGSFNYLIHIDTDEYITLQKFNNIHELIKHYKPFDQLYLNWVFFGDSNIYKVDYNNTSNNNSSSNSSSPSNNKKWLHLEPILHINKLSDDRISSNDIKSIVNLKTCISARNPHYFNKFTVSNPIVKDIFNNIQPLAPTIQLKYADGSIWKNESLEELPCYLSHFICITCYDFFNRRFHYKHGYRTSRLIDEYKNEINVKEFLKHNISFIIKCSLLTLSLEKIVDIISNNNNYSCYGNKEKLAEFIYNISSFYNSHNKNIIVNNSFKNFVDSNKKCIYGDNLTIKTIELITK